MNNWSTEYHYGNTPIEEYLNIGHIISDSGWMRVLNISDIKNKHETPDAQILNYWNLSHEITTTGSAYSNHGFYYNYGLLLYIMK